MKQLSKVKVVLNENETMLLKGGYTDLGNGYVQINFEELIDLFGSPFNIPERILDFAGVNITEEMSASEANQLLQEVGIFDIDYGYLDEYHRELWNIPISSLSDSSESDISASEGDEGDENGPEDPWFLELKAYTTGIMTNVCNSFEQTYNNIYDAKAINMAQALHPFNIGGIETLSYTILVQSYTATIKIFYGTNPTPIFSTLFQKP